MIRWDYNIFIGDESETTHVGFTAGDTVYIVGETFSQSKEQQQTLGAFLEALRSKIETEQPNNLDAFVELVQNNISTSGLDITGLACVYVYDSVSYLLTRGHGELYVSRNGVAQRLLQGSQTASGYIQSRDGFLLTNSSLSQSVDMDMISSLLVKLDPQEFIDSITPDLKGKQNTGMIALCMKSSASFVQETVDDEEIIELDESERPFITQRDNRPESEQKHEPSVALQPTPQSAPPTQSAPQPQASLHQRESHVESTPSRFAVFVNRLKSGTTLGKRVTVGIVIVLVGILAWSVVSGNSRRAKEAFTQDVTTQQKNITESMKKAVQLSGVNDQKALGLIEDAKSTLSTLSQQEKEVGLENTQALTQMREVIDSAERAIRKSEKASYEELYDMTLIDGSAKAVKAYVSGTETALLDTDNGKIYVLDIETKSVDTYQSPRVKSAKFVALHQGVPYFFTKKDGIYSFESAKKDRNVIPSDTEWGAITDFLMYNGNIYLVDSTQNAIYKYLVAEVGYSEKKLYLAEGLEVDLGSATASAVDSSIYVAAGESVLKFTSGSRETFSVSIPDMPDVTFEDVYTSKDVEKVYLLDADSGLLFVVSKSGDFEKQLSARIAKGADDIFATEEGLFVLSGNKLYTIDE